jgi:catechol 2,3-dioxygenase-like lactoylglutathione lyase family enzyme
MRTLTGPDFIALQVSHLEASKAFYVNILGQYSGFKAPDGYVLTLHDGA